MPHVPTSCKVEAKANLLFLKIRELTTMESNPPGSVTEDFDLNTQEGVELLEWILEKVNRHEMEKEQLARAKLEVAESQLLVSREASRLERVSQRIAEAGRRLYHLTLNQMTGKSMVTSYLQVHGNNSCVLQPKSPRET